MQPLTAVVLVLWLLGATGVSPATAQSPSPDPSSMAPSPPATGGGLELLPTDPSFFAGSWSEVKRIIGVDGDLMAVGYLADANGTRGAAWTSAEGLGWKRSHRLPRGTLLGDAVPLADGGVLAIGNRSTKHEAYAAWWRLEPGGRVSKPRRLPLKRSSGNVSRLASDPASGVVAVFGDWLYVNVRPVEWDRAKGPEVLWRGQGSDWQRVKLPSSKHAHPFDIVLTSSGFVLIGEDERGLLAWRSADGRSWDKPEVLPDSLVPRRSYLAKAVVYDEPRDLLLVLGYPDRVWRSSAGAPFETMGPLAAPIGRGSIALGVALIDGFLVAAGGDAKMTLQTSPEGSAWTVAPELPQYGESMLGNLVVQGDQVIGTSLDPIAVFIGQPTIMAYQPSRIVGLSRGATADHLGQPGA